MTSPHPEPSRTSAPPGPKVVLQVEDVSLIRSGRALLSQITWNVEAGQHWVIVGANGSGKTSLIRIASMYEHPSSGRVVVDGNELGRTDVRTLRRRIALVSPALADMIRPGLDCRDVVMSAKFAALEPWWHSYDNDDSRRAEQLLDAQGVAFASDRPFASLSSGQKQRVLLARALMGSPSLVLLDEPCTGLDLKAREELLASLAGAAGDPENPPTVLVTHHVEEIPIGFTHLLALKDGRVVAQGPLAETLNSGVLSETFDLNIELSAHSDGRWSARAA